MDAYHQQKCSASDMSFTEPAKETLNGRLVDAAACSLEPEHMLPGVDDPCLI